MNPLAALVLHHSHEQSVMAEANRNQQRATDLLRENNYQMQDVESMLAARKNDYGDYSDNARVTQAIMDILMTGARSGDLNAMHKEGLHMIVHKMSRIVNGDAYFVDSWDDIAGYAKCVSDRIPKRTLRKEGSTEKDIRGNP